MDKGTCKRKNNKKTPRCSLFKQWKYLYCNCIVLLHPKQTVSTASICLGVKQISQYNWTFNFDGNVGVGCAVWLLLPGSHPMSPHWIYLGNKKKSRCLFYASTGSCQNVPHMGALRPTCQQINAVTRIHFLNTDRCSMKYEMSLRVINANLNVPCLVWFAEVLRYRMGLITL